MTNKERQALIRYYKEGIAEYEMLLEDAFDRNDLEEVKTIRGEIQYNKRQIIALKTRTEFVPRPEETLFFAMMGE